MALPKRTVFLIDKIQLIFEDVQAKQMGISYRKYFKAINADVMELIDSQKKVTKKQINDIVRKHKVDTSFVKRNIEFVRLQTEIEQALVERKITEKEAVRIANYVRTNGRTIPFGFVQVNPTFMRKYNSATEYC